MSLTNNAILASAVTAQAEEKVFINNRAKTFYPNQKGQLPFIKTNQSSAINYAFAITQGNFCENQTELNEAFVRVISFKDVFNTWKRYSHKPNTPYPAEPAELLGWSYNEATDAVTSTVNSSSIIGLVSREKYKDYELEVYLSSTNGDDDSIGITAAFDTDINGIERTINVLRCCGGNGFAWLVSLNFLNAQAGILGTRALNTPQQALAVKWGSGNTGVNAAEAGYSTNLNGGWNGMGRVKVHVQRVGDIITCKCSDFEHWDSTMSYIPEATVTIDLNSNSDLAVFREEAAYGFCASSQVSSSYKVLKFISSKYAVYDVAALVTYVNNGTAWVVAPGRKLSDDYGFGRLLYNRFTGKLFYNDTDQDIYRMNGVVAGPAV